ncbi:MAG: hypothetical protein SLRJCFUN_001512 [Candidatus Fervidibacter sp.]
MDFHLAEDFRRLVVCYERSVEVYWAFMILALILDLLEANFEMTSTKDFFGFHPTFLS